MKKAALLELSREHMQMLIELRNLLRPYGVTISLTDRHANLQLINASAYVEDGNIEQVRARLIAHLPEAQYCYLTGELYEKAICEQCERTLELLSPTPLEQYVACSCGNLLLFIIEDSRSHPRQFVQLPGIYRSEGDNSRIGEMIVENLSHSGARIRSLTPHHFSPNEQFVISFTLDDHFKTIVHKIVRAIHVNGNIIGVRFLESSDLDHGLASYLGINWIRL